MSDGASHPYNNKPKTLNGRTGYLSIHKERRSQSAWKRDRTWRKTYKIDMRRALSCSWVGPTKGNPCDHRYLDFLNAILFTISPWFFHPSKRFPNRDRLSLSKNFLQVPKNLEWVCTSDLRQFSPHQQFAVYVNNHFQSSYVPHWHPSNSHRIKCRPPLLNWHR